jgi:hypothetical protein
MLNFVKDFSYIYQDDYVIFILGFYLLEDSLLLLLELVFEMR